MKRIQTREELCAIVYRIPEEKIPLIGEIIEAMACYYEDVPSETLIEPFEDESALKSEFITELHEAEEAARRGDVVTHEEFLESREKSAPKQGATPEERLQWLRNLPEEDYDMTEEEKASMALGEEDMQAGRVHKFEDVARELDM